MYNIRLEIVKNKPYLFSRFCAVYCLDRIRKFAEFTASVEVHVRSIGIYRISNTSSFMLHTKILDFMPHLNKCFAKLKYICFRSSVWMKEFIDHKYFHIKQISICPASWTYFHQVFILLSKEASSQNPKLLYCLLY